MRTRRPSWLEPVLLLVVIGAVFWWWRSGNVENDARDLADVVAQMPGVDQARWVYDEDPDGWTIPLSRHEVTMDEQADSDDVADVIAAVREETTRKYEEIRTELSLEHGPGTITLAAAWSDPDFGPDDPAAERTLLTTAGDLADAGSTVALRISDDGALNGSVTTETDDVDASAASGFVADRLAPHRHAAATMADFTWTFVSTARTGTKPVRLWQWESSAYPDAERFANWESIVAAAPDGSRVSLTPSALDVRLPRTLDRRELLAMTRIHLAAAHEVPLQLYSTGDPDERQGITLFADMNCRATDGVAQQVVADLGDLCDPLMPDSEE